MGYSNKEGAYWDAVSLAADKNGDALEVRNIERGLLALTWVDAAATDAVVKLQQEVGGIWGDITGMTKTIGAATGSHHYLLTDLILLGANLRAVLTKNSETTGTVSIFYLLKGDR